MQKEDEPLPEAENANPQEPDAATDGKFVDMTPQDRDRMMRELVQRMAQK